MVRYDLHLHTLQSWDSLSSYDNIIRRVQQAGLTGIAVTDHNRLRGALDLAQIAPFPVIVAEEIMTQDGEIIGYFLQEEIPKGLPLEETIARVKAQDGIVGVPHPLDSVRTSSALGEAALLRVIDQIDLIEGWNARCVRPADNEAAQRIATQYAKPMTAGSDAHASFEIGRAFVEMPPFDSAAEFVESLQTANIGGRGRGGWVSLFSTFAKVAKRAGIDTWVRY